MTQIVGLMLSVVVAVVQPAAAQSLVAELDRVASRYHEEPSLGTPS